MIGFETFKVKTWWQGLAHVSYPRLFEQLIAMKIREFMHI
jgi:hypothetical protein